MGRRERQIQGLATTKDEQLRRHRALIRAMHRSPFAHLTQPVSDPDQPGRWITTRNAIRGFADAPIAARWLWHAIRHLIPEDPARAWR